MNRLDSRGSLLLLAILIASIAGCERAVQAGPRPDLAKAQQIRKAISGKSAGGDAAASAQASSSAAKPTGWASLRATVKYAGTAPAPKNISVTPECAKHPLVYETLLVGSGGEVANFVVYLRSNAPAVHPDYSAAEKSTVTLDNSQCRFEPHVLVMRNGQTLVVKNSDDFGHNTKGSPRSNDEFNFTLAAHGQASQPLAKIESGPFAVNCNVHSWMSSWIVLRPDPYAAVSNPQGALEIKNLPAGVDLDLQLWHENAAVLKSAKVEGVKIDSKGRFKLKLEPGKDVELAIQVSG